MLQKHLSPGHRTSVGFQGNPLESCGLQDGASMHKTQMYGYIFISLDCIDSGDRGYRILAMKL